MLFRLIQMEKNIACSQSKIFLQKKMIEKRKTREFLGFTIFENLIKILIFLIFCKLYLFYLMILLIKFNTD